MKYLNISFLILLPVLMFGQVGIGTESPKAQLDIVSSSPDDPDVIDGILIPRIKKFPSADPTSEQNGILIYLIANTGEKKPGFYFWDHDNREWSKMGGNATGNFYKPGTTENPGNIEDPLYRKGNIAIGTEEITARLQIALNAPEDVAIKKGLEVDNNNPATDNLTTYGIVNDNRSATNGNKYGIKNNVGGLGGGIHYGIFNETYQNTGTNEIYGIFNRVGRTYGGFSKHYGIYSEIGSATGQGFVYGIYSTAIGNTPSKVFAGYFVGRVGIGATPEEEYILPATRGKKGQILTLGTTPEVSWNYPGTKNYSTTGGATGNYVISEEVYTLRINNQVSGITLPKASENTGRIIILMGWPGISTKSINFSTGDNLFDVATNSTVSEISSQQVFKIQSAGNRWILLRK